MKNDWILSKDQLPPQGLKVLCFDHGDCWVAQRFQECWFPIPFTDSEFADYEIPKMWKYIDFTEPYTGKTRIGLESMDRLIDMDELEKIDYDAFIKFKNLFKESMDKRNI